MNTTQRLRAQFVARAQQKSGPAQFDLWPQAASIMVFVFGGIVLVGWSLESEALRGFFAKLVALKANTALGFVLAGLSLWMFRSAPAPYHDPEQGQRRRLLAAAYALSVILIGVLTLTEELGGRNLGIDGLVFDRVMTKTGLLQPGRMGLGAALSFVLVGVALLLLDLQRWPVFARSCVAVIALISLFALTGNSFAVHFLFGSDAGSLMAAPTAVAFLVLCLGALGVRVAGRAGGG